MVRWVLVAILAIALVGCGGPAKQPNGKPKAQAKPKPAPVVAPPPKPQPQVDPKAYPDIPAAVADMRQACAALTVAEGAKDRDASQAAIAIIKKSTAWLVLQGNSAVAPLFGEANNKDAPSEFRLAATRALGDIGEPAVGALQQACYSDAYVVRMKAVESLGDLKKPRPETIELLIRLLSDEDGRVRQLAIRSLGNFGDKAKDAGPKLNEILNSNANETERDYAAKALKAVNPRRTFKD